MKKELLLATTVAGITLGAHTAGAVTASYSGHARVGLTDKDTDSNSADTGTMSSHQQASFSVSLEETTDNGTKISGGFDLTDESDGSTDLSGLTLTFDDGSTLQLIEAGDAAYNYEAAVPGASGEQSIGAATSNAAKSGIDGVGGAGTIGLDWSSAADALDTEGLSFGVSYHNNDLSDATASVNMDTSMSAGLSYATTSGDTTITVGVGFVEASDSNSCTNVDHSVWNIGAVAVNENDAGDKLTAGVGIGSGEFAYDQGGSIDDVADWEAVEAGISYVSGDLTFTASFGDATAKDSAAGTVASATEKEDSKESLAMSIDYVVADGVTTTLGYLSAETAHEGTKQDSYSGSSWFVGTDLSF